ncbi:MAG TPA: MMPL family transporter [Candidatus Acidoferrales bacterium]|nr:MMPL family transporter [Candidatus Acidoferrales bacterium]
MLGAWAVLILIAAPLAPRAPGVLSAGGFTSNQLESAKAELLLEQQLGLPPSGLVIVVQSETGARAGDPAFESAVAKAIANVPRAAHVTGVRPHTLDPHQVSADGKVVYEVVSLDLQPDQSPEALAPVQAALVPQPGIRTYLAGGPAFYGDIQTVSESDLRRSELVSLPLAAIALLLVFGSAVSAAIPLAVGGTAVLLSLAIIFVIASLTPMSIFVLNLTTLLGLGLGVDYSLLMTSRFREELARRGGGRLPDGRVDRTAVESAVAVAVASAGRAVFFSGLTVLLGLAGLLLFEFMILRSVGAAGAIVVGLDVAAAMTLLPALLTIAGPRIDALAVRRLRHRDPEAGESGWGRLARWVMARPVRVFVPTLAILVLFGLPFLHARFDAPDASILPESVPSRQAYDLLVREFGPGEFDPLLLAIHTTGPVTSPTNVGQLYDWSRRLAADPRVVRVEGIVDLDPRLTMAQYELLYSAPGGPPDRFASSELQATTRGNLTTFSVYTPYDPNRSAFRALVDELRNPSSALAPPPGMTVQVAGGAADVADVVNAVAAEFPRTALFLVVTTYLALFLLLRSVVLPLKALVMNSLSIVASFGALVWIFQDGNLSTLLGFKPLGFVETTQPVILFCVLFGLSMDYEVFLLSRMKEVYDRTGDNREAVAGGLERSGRIVTSAAAIVVVVAGSFAFADIVLIKALGLGVAIAVALDATVVRALLVPATMRLLGDWNWWIPRRLARWVASRLPLAEAAPVVQLIALVTVAAIVVAACSPEGRLLGQDPTSQPIVPAGSPSPAAHDPRPLTFPRDEAPHDRLTEWWYYTGHLQATDGRRFGFEFVIFRAERGSFPVSWASHLALTDESGHRFVYDQRSEIGPQVDLVTAAELASGPTSGLAAPSSGPSPGQELSPGQEPSQGGPSGAGASPGGLSPGGLSPGGLSLPTGIGPGAGFALGITGVPSAPGVGQAVASPAPGISGQSGSSGAPWIMAGIGGHDILSATSATGGFGLELRLDSDGRPPVLHGDNGWIDFGAAGGSYYYSRTRMAAEGILTIGTQRLQVQGEAWFDHQWGDFIAVGAGGWDWFAVNLSDGTDLTLSLVRDTSGGDSLVYGTLVHPDGTFVHLDSSMFTVQVTAHWTSPATDTIYPAAWTIDLPSQGLTVRLRPSIADQELDTRATTGVVYWEGSQVVSASRNGQPLAGQAYAELTGYLPADPPDRAAAGTS